MPDQRESDEELDGIHQPVEATPEAVGEDASRQPTADIAFPDANTGSPAAASSRVKIMPDQSESDEEPGRIDQPAEATPEAVGEDAIRQPTPDIAFPDANTGSPAVASSRDKAKKFPLDLPISDQKFVLFLARGNAEQVFIECHAIAVKVCNTWPGGLDELFTAEVADDMAFRCGSQYIDKPKAERKFLTKVCTRREIRRRLGERDRGPRSLPSDDAVRTDPSSPHDQLVEIWGAEMPRELVAVALQQLTFDQATAVYLREIVGMEYLEIADRMKKTKTCVRKLVSRALETLREWWLRQSE